MLRDALLKFTRELSARLVIRSVSETMILVNDDAYSESIALTPENTLLPFDSHPNPKAHRKMARKLLPTLKALTRK